MSWEFPWLQEQIDLYLMHERPRYQAYGQLLESILKRARQKLAPLARIESRAKEPASFAEKCIRKSAKYAAPAYQLTDLCGARVIVDTKEEADLICRFIRRYFSIDEANSEDVRERLKSGEFGYRSVHFVVQVPLSIVEKLELNDQEKKWLAQVNEGDSPETIRTRKAEIQVRTHLQNIWANSFHDRIYKSKLQLPEDYRREASRLAALMESADNGFGDLTAKIDAYEVDYGAYMTPEKMQQEIAILSTVLNYRHEDNYLCSDPHALALRIAKIGKAAGDWQAVVDATRKFVDQESRERDRLRTEYGYALCKLHENDTSDPAFADGQRCLEQVARPWGTDDESEPTQVEMDVTRAQALACLAWSIQTQRRGDFVRRAGTLYRQAYLLDSSNPYHFREFLECQLELKRGDIKCTDLLRPHVDTCIARCQEHAQVGIELPYAYFTIAKLHLFAERPRDCMLAFTQAICTSGTEHPIEEELRSIVELLEHVDDKSGSLEQSRKLLVIGKLAKLQLMVREAEQARKAAAREYDELAKNEITDDDKTDLRQKESELRKLEEKATELDELAEHCRSETLVDELPVTWKGSSRPFAVCKNDLSLRTPIVIVVGGANPKLNEMFAPYREVLESALGGFEGTVFCGGTRQGIPGIVGDISADQDFTLFGYMPEHLPHDADKDEENYTLYFVGDKEFSFVQPLQNWIDILGAGIDPSDVRVLGINGGTISKFEFYLALAMGATVGLVEQSGRAASKLLEEDTWWKRRQLIRLPFDAMSVRAFLHTSQPDWERPELESAARIVHGSYVASAKPKGPSFSTWEDLPPDFKRSCYHQVLYAESILSSAGLIIREKAKDEIELLDLEATLGTERLRELAEMEHGRWNVERLMQGWTYGEKKDVVKKTSPYLVRWENLSEEIKGYDIDAVKNLPEVLREAGLEVYKP